VNALIVRWPFLYIAHETGLSIVDVSDPAAPSEVGAISTSSP
jgi:hypothetical protein